MNQKGIERILIGWIAYLQLMDARSTAFMNCRRASIYAAFVALSYVFQRKSDPISAGPAGPIVLARRAPRQVKRRPRRFRTLVPG